MTAPRVLTEQMIREKTKVTDLAEVRHLNLWGEGLSDVSIVTELPNIEVLALAVNHVSSLKCFGQCPTLQELYLRKNAVANLREVTALKDLKNLRTLWLLDNPCSKHPYYREFVLHCCRGLKQLDNLDVTAEERVSAAKRVTVRVLQEIVGRPSGQADSPASPGSSTPINAANASTGSGAGAPARPATQPQSAPAPRAVAKEQQPSPAAVTPQSAAVSPSATPIAEGGSGPTPQNSSSPSRSSPAMAPSAGGGVTGVQAQEAVLSAIRALLPTLTPESLELLQREVNVRVEKSRRR